jgi:hypothetical protein
MQARILLIICAVIFSGCAPKIQYVVEKCKTDKPVRQYNGTKCGLQGQKLTGDKLAVCIVSNDKKKDADVANLDIAFESCK